MKIEKKSLEIDIFTYTVSFTAKDTVHVNRENISFHVDTNGVHDCMLAVKYVCLYVFVDVVAKSVLLKYYYVCQPSVKPGIEATILN